MSTSQITFGTCPNGGLWYTCTAQNPTFFGCCTSNPCNGIGCPSSDLRAAGMGYGPGPDSGYANDHSYWPNVSCVLGKWYTCAATTPTFQGCCVSNPCDDNGACAMGNLFPAAFDHIGDSSTSASSTSSSTTSSMTTTSSTSSTGTSASSGTVGSATTTSTTAPLPSVSSSPGPNIALIAGASAGGAFVGIALLLLLAFCLRKSWKKRAAAKTQEMSYEPERVGVGYDDKANHTLQHTYIDPKNKHDSTLSPPLSPAPPAYGAQSPRQSTYGHERRISEMESPLPSPNPNVGGFEDRTQRNMGGPRHVAELGVHEVFEVEEDRTGGWGRR